MSNYEKTALENGVKMYNYGQGYVWVKGKAFGKACKNESEAWEDACDKLGLNMFTYLEAAPWSTPNTRGVSNPSTPKVGDILPNGNRVIRVGSSHVFSENADGDTWCDPIEDVSSYSPPKKRFIMLPNVGSIAWWLTDDSVLDTARYMQNRRIEELAGKVFWK